MRTKKTVKRLLALLLALALVFSSSFSGAIGNNNYAKAADSEEWTIPEYWYENSDGNWGGKYTSKTDDVYVCLDAPVSTLSYYSLSGYYSYYPSYFQDADGNDLYAAFTEKYASTDFVSVKEDDLAYQLVYYFCENLWGETCGYYWYTLGFYYDDTPVVPDPVEDVTDDRVITPYMQVADASGNSYLTEFDDDDLYICFTDPSEYAFTDYYGNILSMEGFYYSYSGYYQSYFQDEEGNDLFAALEELAAG